MVRLDAGVDDRHVGVDPLVDAVDLRDRVALGEDPRDAGRRRLARDLDDLVRNDGEDARIGFERLALLRVKAGAEAADRLAEVRSALIPFSRPIRSRVALVSVPSSRRTMKRPATSGRPCKSSPFVAGVSEGPRRASPRGKASVPRTADRWARARATLPAARIRPARTVQGLPRATPRARFGVASGVGSGRRGLGGGHGGSVGTGSRPERARRPAGPSGRQGKKG